MGTQADEMWLQIGFEQGCYGTIACWRILSRNEPGKHRKGWGYLEQLGLPLGASQAEGAVDILLLHK